MKRFFLVLILFVLIPIIATADFDLIYSDYTVNFISKYTTATELWEKANNDTSGKEMAQLWTSVLWDVKKYDPTFDSYESDKPLGLIGIDRSANDIHIYILNSHYAYTHIQLFRAFANNSSNASTHEMIYEKTDVSLEDARKKLSTITDSQYEFTYETLKNVIKGE